METHVESLLQLEEEVNEVMNEPVTDFVHNDAPEECDIPVVIDVSCGESSIAEPHNGVYNLGGVKYELIEDETAKSKFDYVIFLEKRVTELEEQVDNLIVLNDSL